MNALIAPVRDLPRMNTAEFAAFEQTRPHGEKWQLINGALFMMTGGTIRHARIIGNVQAALRRRIKGGPCEVFASDAKIVNDERHFAAYPDIVVRCAQPPLDLELAMSDPSAVIEVLSPTTQHLDRGDKLFEYQQIASLGFYAIVFPEERRIEAWTRANEGFVERIYKRVGESMRVEPLSIEIPLDEIYEGVPLGPDA